MTLPALPDLTAPCSDLSVLRGRLAIVRASLRKACKELDAQIEALESLEGAGSRDLQGPNLFESEPVPPVPAKALAVVKAPAVPVKQQPTTSIVMAATAPATLDPELEQATLEELNSALSKAFAQISGRQEWAG